MNLVKNCENCEVTYNRMNKDCVYCEVNPAKSCDNFKQKMPRLNGDFTIEIPDINEFLKFGYSWDINISKKDGRLDKRELVIYLRNMTLFVKLSNAFNMLDLETCKLRVAEHWRLKI